VAQATRSSDPRANTLQFQEYRENSTLRALEVMRLRSETKAVPQPTVTCSDYLSKTLSERLQHAHPRPPTPPRPSQKRLVEEEEESRWDDDVNCMSVLPTAANNAGWDEDGIDEVAGGATSKHRIRDEETAARGGGQVDDDEIEEGTADDCTKGEGSPRSTRLYTQGELVILTRKIFGDEDGEDDGVFWEDTGATIDHPAKNEGACVDQQDQRSDTGEQSEESEGKASKPDGLFGPTSNFCLSTSSKDGLPRSHQDEDDDRTAEVVQDALETAAGSATLNTSGGVSSSEDDTPPTTTASTPFTSTEAPRTALSLSTPMQCPMSPESGFGNRLTKGGAPTGDLWPGKSPEADAEPNEGLSDSLPLPASQLDPSTGEMEPSKPAAVAPSEEEPHCNTIRRIVRKRGLPEFSPTRPGIFFSPEHQIF
jgi:hypothetical protein